MVKTTLKQTFDLLFQAWHRHSINSWKMVGSDPIREGLVSMFNKMPVLHKRPLSAKDIIIEADDFDYGIFMYDSEVADSEGNPHKIKFEGHVPLNDSGDPGEIWVFTSTGKVIDKVEFTRQDWEGLGDYLNDSIELARRDFPSDEYEVDDWVAEERAERERAAEAKFEEDDEAWSTFRVHTIGEGVRISSAASQKMPILSNTMLLVKALNLYMNELANLNQKNPDLSEDELRQQAADVMYQKMPKLKGAIDLVALAEDFYGEEGLPIAQSVKYMDALKRSGVMTKKPAKKDSITSGTLEREAQAEFNRIKAKYPELSDEEIFEMLSEEGVGAEGGFQPNKEAKAAAFQSKKDKTNSSVPGAIEEEIEVTKIKMTAPELSETEIRAMVDGEEVEGGEAEVYEGPVIETYPEPMGEPVGEPAMEEPMPEEPIEEPIETEPAEGVVEGEDVGFEEEEEEELTASKKEIIKGKKPIKSAAEDDEEDAEVLDEDSFDLDVEDEGEEEAPEGDVELEVDDSFVDDVNAVDLGPGFAGDGEVTKEEVVEIMEVIDKLADLVLEEEGIEEPEMEQEERIEILETVSELASSLIRSGEEMPEDLDGEEVAVIQVIPEDGEAEATFAISKQDVGGDMGETVAVSMPEAMIEMEGEEVSDLEDADEVKSSVILTALTSSFSPKIRTVRKKIKLNSGWKDQSIEHGEAWEQAEKFVSKEMEFDPTDPQYWATVATVAKKKYDAMAAAALRNDNPTDEAIEAPTKDVLEGQTPLKEEIAQAFAKFSSKKMAMQALLKTTKVLSSMVKAMKKEDKGVEPIQSQAACPLSPEDKKKKKPVNGFETDDAEAEGDGMVAQSAHSRILVEPVRSSEVKIIQFTEVIPSVFMASSYSTAKVKTPVQKVRVLSGKAAQKFMASVKIKASRLPFTTAISSTLKLGKRLFILRSSSLGLMGIDASLDGDSPAGKELFMKKGDRYVASSGKTMVRKSDEPYIFSSVVGRPCVEHPDIFVDTGMKVFQAMSKKSASRIRVLSQKVEELSKENKELTSITNSLKDRAQEADLKAQRTHTLSQKVLKAARDDKIHSAVQSDNEMTKRMHGSNVDHLARMFGGL